MGKIKWYYIAIPVALVLAYLMFSSKGTLAKSGTGTSGVGSTLTGAGAAASGLAKLWESVSKTLGDDDTSDNGEV